MPKSKRPATPNPKRRDPTAAEMEQLISIYPEAEGMTYEEIIEKIFNARDTPKSAE